MQFITISKGSPVNLIIMETNTQKAGKAVSDDRMNWATDSYFNQFFFYFYGKLVPAVEVIYTNPKTKFWIRAECGTVR